VFALVGESPGKRLIDKLKDGLRSTNAFQEAPSEGVRAEQGGGDISEQLARLAELHAKGVLDADEFKAAKAKLLG